MTILRAKVEISRTMWLAAAVVVAVWLANTVVMQKGGDVVRFYEVWLGVFRPSSYAGTDFIEVVEGLGVVGGYTVVFLGISAGAGWLVAAITGSIAVLFRRR